MSDTESIVDELVDILEEDFYALITEGDSVNTKFGLFETVHVVEGSKSRWSRRNSIITKAPDGRHFRWQYDEGLTENQDSMGPAEIDVDVKLVEVVSEEVVTVNLVWRAV